MPKPDDFVRIRAMATSTLLTIEDFELLPAEAAENHELVEGELVDVSGNTPRHNKLRDRLVTLMLPWLTERGLGTAIAEQEFNFLGNAHGPDVSILGPAKAALFDLDRRVQRFVPDLAIEVASQSDTYEGLLAKKERYLKSGTGEVWLFSLRTRELAIYGAQRTLTLRGADAITTDLMPAFSIAVEELLRGL
jgi:Uma2 family endonuclease